MRAPRRAGKRPKAIPVTTADVSAAMIDQKGMDAGIGVLASMKSARPAPRARPSAPPRKINTDASTRNRQRISFRVAPTALRMPISRVRSGHGDHHDADQSAIVRPLANDNDVVGNAATPRRRNLRRGTVMCTVGPVVLFYEGQQTSKERAMASAWTRRNAWAWKSLARVPKATVALMVVLLALFAPVDATSTGGMLGATPVCAAQEPGTDPDDDEGGCGIASACMSCGQYAVRCAAGFVGSCAMAAYYCSLCASQPIDCGMP